MEQPLSQPSVLSAAPSGTAAKAGLPPSPLSLFIPILPRFTLLADGTDSSSSASSAPPSHASLSAAHTAPALAAVLPSPAPFPLSPPSCSSQSAVSGRAEADKRPAPKGLYSRCSATDVEASTAAGLSTSAPSLPAAPATVTAPAPPTERLPSSARSVVSSVGGALLSFHRQLTAPQLYSHEEAIRIRAEIESQYVHFLRCWQQRANPHIQQTTGAVNPLIDAHSKLQQTFTGQYAAAISGDSKGTVQQQQQHTDHAQSRSHAAAAATAQLRQPQQRRTAEQQAAASPTGDEEGGSGSSEARQRRDIAVAAAVDEVRKSARKRRPPKLLAEDDDDGRAADGGTAELLPLPQSAMKRQRGERAAAEESIADERHPQREQATGFSSGRILNGWQHSADGGDVDVVVVEDASSQSEHSANRPRRSATATRKRDVLLAHHFFRHFSLRCYSISSPPVPPPSFAASPPNCSASVNYQLYMQSAAMLKAQFPKIGKADQPSTSYYACLCVEPVSAFYPYCASLLPPRVRASVAADSAAPLPIVLSSSLFDLCDGLYFRILFFTSPYTTNGFATLLLAHLRLLAVRLHSRLIVCATKAQKQFWISCGFRGAGQHWGGLNFGDTMLLGCELMDESREEEQRRRMAYKSEERLQSKAALIRGRAATTGGRQRTTVIRQAEAGRRADDGKKTGFHRAGPTSAAFTAQQQRDKRQGSKDLTTVDSRRATPTSVHILRPIGWAAATSTSPALQSPSASASLSTSPSPSLSVLDPLQVYHPYIVRSVRSGKLLPIRGPPLVYQRAAQLLPSSPFVPSAAVMCVTQQSAYHKGGSMLLTFTLQRGTLIEEELKQGADSSLPGAATSTSSTAGRISLSSTDERVWRVKLVVGKRGGGAVVSVPQHFLYPLGEGWRERYGLPTEQLMDDAMKEGGGSHTGGRGEAVKDEEGREEEDDSSESGVGDDGGRTRSVPELIDLMDDSDRSTNPTPDPLGEPQQQQRAHDGQQQKHGELLDDGDDSSDALDDRSLVLNGDGKLLSTPTLHATADTDTPPSPLAFPLPAMDEPASSSSPDMHTSPSPSPSPTLAQPLSSPHTARLQLILPMSPAHAQRDGDGEVDGQLAAQEAEVEVEVDDEDDDEEAQPGQSDKHRSNQLEGSKPLKYPNGYLTFGVKGELEHGVSIFAMMS